MIATSLPTLTPWSAATATRVSNSAHFPDILLERLKQILTTPSAAGHMARDCPEPKDWSKVKCNRCGESELIPDPAQLSDSLANHETVGHTVKRCPQPEEGGFDEVAGEDPFSSQADDVQADKSQDDANQDDEVEKVRQCLDDQSW